MAALNWVTPPQHGTRRYGMEWLIIKNYWIKIQSKTSPSKEPLINIKAWKQILIRTHRPEQLRTQSQSCYAIPLKS